jgi:hypothetical protein
MNLQDYRDKAEQALTRFEALRSFVAQREDLSVVGKAQAEAQGREAYEATLAALNAEALAELEANRATLAKKADKVHLARWERFRAALGEQGAVLVFMEQVKATDYAERLALYEEADPWGKAIIEALTPTATPKTAGEVVQWSPLNDRLAQERPAGEVALVQAERELAHIEEQLSYPVTGLDVLAKRQHVRESIGTPASAARQMDAPAPLGDFSNKARQQARSDLVGYMSTMSTASE